MEKLVTVATFDYAAQADVIRLLLEEQGFEVFMADDNLVGMDWFMANAVGGAKLQVPESKAAAAAAFVEQHRDRVRNATRNDKGGDKPEVSFKCEECGKAISFPGHRRGGVETCPFCKQFVDVPE